MTSPIEMSDAVSRIANAIGEPARARMLFALLDNHERTSTELAMIADVSPPTASAHLSRLREEGLIQVHVQGRHRYHGLSGPTVAQALEGLSALAGTARKAFVPRTPDALRSARTCYDHIAGSLGVSLHDRFTELRWIAKDAHEPGRSYELSPAGEKAFTELGVRVDDARASRRRFAYPCLDWSERRPHLGGALGAALLAVALERKWVARERDSRALRVTGVGQREMARRFAVHV
jgi:DNA-binding transcriptional ArsR family regulator